MKNLLIGSSPIVSDKGSANLGSWVVCWFLTCLTFSASFVQ